jgi:triacylglycerol lipase
MNVPFRNHLLALGVDITPPMVQETQRFLAERFVGISPDTVISRDQVYGPDERQRLDVFSSASTRDAPVLVFVHGGGFVMGDKRLPGLPFYDNVGDFAVRSGLVGVTMTYRLAPSHRWPAGPEDVAAAVRWVRASIAPYGGDPRQIFLMGQSAGAVHVAGYVADSRLHETDGGIAGALLVSGIYDVAQAEPSPLHVAYYGEDHASWSERSTLAALAESEVPLLFCVSELDPTDFQRQAALLVAACARRRGRFPRMHWLGDHNHLSPVLALGTPLDTLGPLIRQFIAGVNG